MINLELPEIQKRVKELKRKKLRERVIKRSNSFSQLGDKANVLIRVRIVKAEANGDSDLKD